MTINGVCWNGICPYLGTKNVEISSCSTNEQNNEGSEKTMQELESLAAIGKAFLQNTSKKCELTQRQSEAKERLEKQGINVAVRDDGKFVLSPQDEKTKLSLSGNELWNVAEINGNVCIYSTDGTYGYNHSYNDLKKVSGSMEINSFFAECRGSGDNFSYACDIKFPNLTEAESITAVSSSCNLYLDNLKNINGGAIKIDNSCDSDMLIYIDKIVMGKGGISIVNR